MLILHLHAQTEEIEGSLANFYRFLHAGLDNIAHNKLRDNGCVLSAAELQFRGVVHRWELADTKPEPE